MARSRLDIDSKLKGLLSHVYFQPPETIKLSYPCAIYEVSTGRQFYADNKSYTLYKAYNLTVIDRNPDNNWIEAITDAFECCAFDRSFTSDNLYHYTFTIYY